MSITLFGVLWIGLLICAFLLTDIKYIVFFLILSMTLQCVNVVLIGEIGVGPQTITCFFFLVKSLLVKPKILCVTTYKKTNTTLLVLSLFLFLLVVVISIVANSIYDLNTIMRLVQLILYVLCFIRMICLSNYLSEKKLGNIIYYITWFVLVLGLIQFFITAGYLPRFSIVSHLFYNEQSENVYYYSNSYYRLCSTFMEPSYCSVFLVGVFAFFSVKTFNSIKYKVLFIPIVLELILTKSSTGYVAFASVLLLKIIFGLNKKSNTMFIFLCILLFPIIMLYGKNILEEVIFNKMSSGSAMARNWWNKESINDFQSSMIYGVGYKNSRGSSIIYSILGQLGIMGLVSYLLFCFSILLIMLKNKKNNSSITGFAFAIIGAFICQLIACPDIDLSPFWLFCFMLGGSFTSKGGDLSVEKNISSCFIKNKDNQFESVELMV